MSFEENHNITNSDLKQKSRIWKSMKERTTIPWGIANDLIELKTVVKHKKNNFKWLITFIEITYILILLQNTLKYTSI